MSNQKNALQAIIERFFELQELKYREWDEDFIDEDIKIMEFNPWIYSSYNQLYSNPKRRYRSYSSNNG